MPFFGRELTWVRGCPGQPAPDLCLHSTARAGMLHTCSGWQRNSSPPWGSCPCLLSFGQSPCWRNQTTGVRWCATPPPGTSTTGRTSGLDTGRGGFWGSRKGRQPGAEKPVPRSASTPAPTLVVGAGFFQGRHWAALLSSFDSWSALYLGMMWAGAGQRTCMFPPAPRAPGQYSPQALIPALPCPALSFTLALTLSLPQDQAVHTGRHGPAVHSTP